MSGAIVPVGEIERMARAVAESKLFGVKSPEQATALMLVAQAEGMHPAIAARDYHVVQGRPALKADAMLARFQQAGGKVRWTAYTDTRVSGVFSHPSGGEVEVDWTIAQAKSAGLTGKDVWRQYPRAMLRARVISEGIRTVFPGVAVGVYTVEEVQDFDARPSASAPRVEAAESTAAPPLADDTHRDAEAAAGRGIAAYQAFFGALSREQKQAIIASGRHDALKQQAMQSTDAVIVEAGE
jgi:hypothetical protein